MEHLKQENAEFVTYRESEMSFKKEFVDRGNTQSNSSGKLRTPTTKIPSSRKKQSKLKNKVAQAP